MRYRSGQEDVRWSGLIVGNGWLLRPTSRSFCSEACSHTTARAGKGFTADTRSLSPLRHQTPPYRLCTRSNGLRLIGRLCECEAIQAASDTTQAINRRERRAKRRWNCLDSSLDQYTARQTDEDTRLTALPRVIVRCTFIGFWFS